MVYQNIIQQMKAKTPDNSDNETQMSNSTGAGSKARRKASAFFKKALKQGDDSSQKGEDPMKRLKNENRRLRQELKDANNRIRELENLNRAQEQRLLTFAKPDPSATPPDAHYTAEGTEYRDDEGSEDTNDQDNSFSVEVAAITRGSKVQGEFLDVENEAHSVAPSAKTIPTGNDKKSNQRRRQHQVRQKLRRSLSSKSSGIRGFQGEDAYLDYFSRRSSPPLESITEIETKSSLFEAYDMGSTTSELTASVASSTMLDEESVNSATLMSGRRLPFSSMKSLLRISSEEAETISFYPADDIEEVFGEI